MVAGRSQIISQNMKTMIPAMQIWHWARCFFLGNHSAVSSWVGSYITLGLQVIHPLHPFAGWLYAPEMGSLNTRNPLTSTANQLTEAASFICGCLYRSQIVVWGSSIVEICLYRSQKLRNTHTNTQVSTNKTSGSAGPKLESAFGQSPSIWAVLTAAQRHRKDNTTFHGRASQMRKGLYQEEGSYHDHRGFLCALLCTPWKFQISFPSWGVATTISRVTSDRCR